MIGKGLGNTFDGNRWQFKDINVSLQRGQKVASVRCRGGKGGRGGAGGARANMITRHAVMESWIRWA